MGKNILSIIGTVGSKVSDISIKNGQLIFVQDKHRIALDFNGKRTFYNDITTIETDEERQSMLAPINGCFYFVINTAILWFYNDKWIQVTTSPQEVLFIGMELPNLGSENKLYVNTSGKNISIWDIEEKKYEIVADATEEISEDEISSLFQ